MAASYPTSVKAFSVRATGDTIQAAHVNDLQDEVTAIENALINGIAHDLNVTGAVTMSGLLTVDDLISITGFGQHEITAGGTGTNVLRIRNSTAGTGNIAALYLDNDVGLSRGQLTYYSSTYTTSTYAVASGIALTNGDTGGVSIGALSASGSVRFYAGGTTLRAQITSTGLLEHNSAFGLSGINTPAQIAANTNDYAPTDFATGFFFRIASDAARDLTGLAGGAQGRVVVLSNQGAFTITIQHDSASSLAANRIRCPGAAAFSLTTMMSVFLYYDSTAARWQVVA